MNIELKNKIAVETKSAKIFETLPADIRGFKLKNIFADDDDKFIFFAYVNENFHRSLSAYFHAETSEYKVRVNIGLNEFCLTRFFTSDFAQFEKILAAELDPAIKNLINDEPNPLVEEKNFPAWAYGKNLPNQIGGFELFINPSRPIKFTNGSHIVINYCNFETASDLTIFYNIYGDNFSGEVRISRVPHVSYLFDSENLAELEEKLSAHLVGELERIEKIFL